MLFAVRPQRNTTAAAAAVEAHVSRGVGVGGFEGGAETVGVDGVDGAGAGDVDASAAPPRDAGRGAAEELASSTVDFGGFGGGVRGGVGGGSLVMFEKGTDYGAEGVFVVFGSDFGFQRGWDDRFRGGGIECDFSEGYGRGWSLRRVVDLTLFDWDGDWVPMRFFILGLSVLQQNVCVILMSHNFIHGKIRCAPDKGPSFTGFPMFQRRFFRTLVPTLIFFRLVERPRVKIRWLDTWWLIEIWIKRL